MFFTGFIAKLFSSTTSIFIMVLVVLASLIIIPNSSTILERFGFETRAVLKEKNAVLEIGIDTAIQANVNNQQIQKAKDDIRIIGNDAATRIDTHIEKRDIVITKVVNKHQKDITIAKINPPKIKVSSLPIPSIEVIEATSQANITLLWDTFDTLTSTKKV